MKKETKILLAGKEYKMCLDLRSAIEFKKLQGITIFQGIDDIVEQQDIEVIVNLLCATVRDSKGKSIAKDKILSLDLMESLPTIMNAFTELFSKEEGIEE